MSSPMSVIPVNEPVIGQAEIANVLDCLKSGWISSAGKYIEQFEERWARECGVKYGVAVSSGTTALEVAVQALDLNPGDEVIMPTFTIVSCALAVIQAGAIPVLVDSEPRNGCIDVTQVAAKVTPRTRVLMPVHMYGHPVDMDPLLHLARKHELIVLEDAAEVHGAEYLSNRAGQIPTWRRCGGIGDLATFSFFANKLITTGEGGMVVTDDLKLAQKMRSLRNLCFGPPRRFLHAKLGHNYRLTNMQAAVGVAQIERLPEIVARKRAIAARYNDRLSRHEASFQLPSEESWARSVFWVYGIVLRERLDFDAEIFAKRLESEGIETRPFFLGMHEQPALWDKGLFKNERGLYPVAERWSRRGLYLPAGVAITDDQIDKTCDVIERIIND